MSDIHFPVDRRPRVWIVDDSPLELAFTARTLAGAYDTETFPDGASAIERLVTDHPLPDLMLLDWVMPGMTGGEVCRFIRENPRTSALPIIFVTASRVETEDVVRGLASGANDYVPRPFAPEELRARVAAAIRSKQLADAALVERQRLAAINRLSHALLEASLRVEDLLELLATVLSDTLCDGCSIMALPGLLPQVAIHRHRADPTGEALGKIAALTDPAIFHFGSPDEARVALAPSYHPYIDRYGLSSLAILPFPLREPLEGVVTVTRDGSSPPFAAEDIATIETCIQYAGLAVVTALRFRAEHQAREQLDSVLADLPLGIIVVDLAGRLVLVNEAARSLVPTAAVGDGLDQLYEAAAWSTRAGVTLSKLEWQRILGHAEIDTELELSIAGRPPRIVSLSSRPLLENGGIVAGQIIVVEDVTARSAVAIERERIAEFQTEMMAIVGHDLRNPLSAILTGTALIAEVGKQLPPVVATVRRVENSALRIKRIVEQLLDMTRARLGGGIPVTPRSVSWRQILASVVDEMTLAFPKAVFRLHGTDDQQVMVDPDRIAQVLSNLMTNAVNYGATGSAITITSVVEPDQVSVSVHNLLRDKPVPADQLLQIFDPYRRGHGTSDHTLGLGLGLYIVRELVRAHRGFIEATSTDQGTTFRVVLPSHGA